MLTLRVNTEPQDPSPKPSNFVDVPVNIVNNTDEYYGYSNDSDYTDEEDDEENYSEDDSYIDVESQLNTMATLTIEKPKTKEELTAEIKDKLLKTRYASQSDAYAKAIADKIMDDKKFSDKVEKSIEMLRKLIDV